MIKIGCQAYTWQMSGEKWKGRVVEILDIVAAAGYEGYETEFWFLGNYTKDPEGLKKLLAKRNLTLVALGVAKSWTDSENVEEELQEAYRIADYLASFPGTILEVAGGTSENRENIDEKFSCFLESLGQIAEYARSRKVPVAFHPHSHFGSIFESEADYNRLLHALETTG